HAFVPLLERASRISLIEFDRYVWMVRIRIQNFPALVGRTVVQQDQLKVLTRLRQDAVQPFAQISRMFVVRNNDANFGHEFGRHAVGQIVLSRALFRTPLHPSQGLSGSTPDSTDGLDAAQLQQSSKICAGSS